MLFFVQNQISEFLYSQTNLSLTTLIGHISTKVKQAIECKEKGMLQKLKNKQMWLTSIGVTQDVQVVLLNFVSFKGEELFKRN